MQIRGLRCLVTGGAGFIGSHLVDRLVANDNKVEVLDNLSNGSLGNLSAGLAEGNCVHHPGDIADTAFVDALVAEVDVVFHLACLGVRHSLAHRFENCRVNAEGTLCVLEACLRHKVDRVLFCSSSEVYGTADYVPMPESHPTHPCTLYGASKLAGEAYARAYSRSYGLPVVIVRPFNSYGPRSHFSGDAAELIPRSIARALVGQDLVVFGDGSQTRDFTYVADTADALLYAAENDRLIGKTSNVGSGFEISVLAVAEKVMELVENSESKIAHIAQRPGDVLRLYADNSFYREMDGPEPVVGFADGMRRTVDWFSKMHTDAPELFHHEPDRNW